MFIPCDCGERETEGEIQKKIFYRLWIDSLRSIRNYQPLQLRFLLHLNKLSDKCRAQISTVEIVICIIAPIVNALKLKNPCMCTILNANFSKLSLINSLWRKSKFDQLYWKKESILGLHVRHMLIGAPSLVLQSQKATLHAFVFRKLTSWALSNSSCQKTPCPI